MNASQEKATALLHDLCQPTGKSQERHRRALIERETGTQGWAYYLPEPIWPALDVGDTDVIENQNGIRDKRRYWTQGASFSFQNGDIIYDTPHAYDRPWGEALTFIQKMIKVTFASPARGEYRDKISDAPPLYTYFPRVSGEVRWEQWETFGGRLRMVETKRSTQDDFVHFLITGELPQLKLASTADLVPSFAVR